MYLPVATLPVSECVCVCVCVFTSGFKQSSNKVLKVHQKQDEVITIITFTDW